MNTVVIKRGLHNIVDNLALGKIVALVASVLLILYPATRDIAFTALSESYYQVSIFVAATLIGLIMFERAQKREMREIACIKPFLMAFKARCALDGILD